MNPAGEFYVNVRLIISEKIGGDDKAVRKFGRVELGDRARLEEIVKSTQFKGKIVIR